MMLHAVAAFNDAEPPLPVVFGGDFNALPQSPVATLLRRWDGGLGVPGAETGAAAARAAGSAAPDDDGEVGRLLASPAARLACAEAGRRAVAAAAASSASGCDGATRASATGADATSAAVSDAGATSGLVTVTATSSPPPASDTAACVPCATSDGAASADLPSRPRGAARWAPLASAYGQYQRLCGSQCARVQVVPFPRRAPEGTGAGAKRGTRAAAEPTPEEAGPDAEQMAGARRRLAARVRRHRALLTWVPTCRAASGQCAARGSHGRAGVHDSHAQLPGHAGLRDVQSAAVRAAPRSSAGNLAGSPESPKQLSRDGTAESAAAAQLPAGRRAEFVAVIDNALRPPPARRHPEPAARASRSDLPIGRLPTRVQISWPARACRYPRR